MSAGRCAASTLTKTVTASPLFEFGDSKFDIRECPSKGPRAAGERPGHPSRVLATRRRVASNAAERIGCAPLSTAGSPRSSVRLGRAVNFYEYPIRADGELAQSPSQVAPTDGWTTAEVDRLLPGS